MLLKYKNIKTTEIYPAGYVYNTLKNGIIGILSYGVNTQVTETGLNKITSPLDDLNIFIGIKGS
ncbi:MAG: hypothetical protein U9P79_01490 [Candidatus Cloacimonadota bacterium]|nr:hypothetical protein [Candidatus Cloacimonadota bacterium]